jgi:hypothetical protein
MTGVMTATGGRIFRGTPIKEILLRPLGRIDRINEPEDR